MYLQLLGQTCDRVVVVTCQKIAILCNNGFQSSNLPENHHSVQKCRSLEAVSPKYHNSLPYPNSGNCLVNRSSGQGKSSPGKQEGALLCVCECKDGHGGDESGREDGDGCIMYT